MIHTCTFDVSNDPVYVITDVVPVKSVAFIETRKGTGSLSIKSGLSPDSMTASATINTEFSRIHRQDLPIDGDFQKIYHKFQATGVTVNITITGMSVIDIYTYNSYAKADVSPVGPTGPTGSTGTGP